MSTITLPEEEYRRLLETVRQLSARLTRLQTIQPQQGQLAQTSAATRLHGIIPLPAGFDEKRMIADEILKKHLGDG
jgi:hypothetical protein